MPVDHSDKIARTVNFPAVERNRHIAITQAGCGSFVLFVIEDTSGFGDLKWKTGTIRNMDLRIERTVCHPRLNGNYKQKQRGEHYQERPIPASRHTLSRYQARREDQQPGLDRTAHGSRVLVSLEGGDIL
jgi:hypothetical protein